jgi:hypothetical protein
MVRAGNSRLRIYWDGESTPSVDAPLKFLVGDGAGVYQPQGRALVSGLLAGAKGDGSSMDFSLYYPMPFHSTARITLTSDPSASVLDKLGWRLRLQPFPDPAGWWGTLHVTYTSVPNPVPGQDMTFLDVSGSGRVVGTVINFSRVGGTLEGNPSFYIDNSPTPQVEGTGTEEWGLGGNYWNGNHQTTLPLGGLPSSTNNPPGTDVDGAAEYRFLVADSVPFNDHLTLRWQHGGRDETTEPYRAAVMWYGTSSQTAPLTDEVHVGDPPSAASHHYSSPGAVPSTLTAAYGYGLQAGATTDTGDTSTGTTSFTMRLDPANAGAFLRRMSDYSLPNQRSNVFVDGRFAGTWYAAGSFGGTDAQGVSRRWRDDEFPLPASLTAGKTAVSIQIQFVRTPADNAWSEFGYQMYSFVPPGGCVTPTEPKPGPPQQLGIAAPAGHRGGHPAPGTAVLAAAAGLAFVSLVGLALLRKRSRAPGG